MVRRGIQPSGYTEVDDIKGNVKVNFLECLQKVDAQLIIAIFCIVILENVTLNVQLDTICLDARQMMTSDLTYKLQLQKWLCVAPFSLTASAA